MRYVVLPQAIKNILPALGNEFVTIIKDSSLLQTIGGYGIVEWCTNCCNNNILDLDAALVRSLLLFDCDNGYDGTLETKWKNDLGEGRK